MLASCLICVEAEVDWFIRPPASKLSVFLGGLNLPPLLLITRLLDYDNRFTLNTLNIFPVKRVGMTDHILITIKHDHF